MKARLFRQRTLFSVLVPKRELPAELRQGRPPVVVQMGRERFETTLLAHSARSLRLILPAPIVRERGWKIGDELTFTIFGDRGRQVPAVPPELVRALELIGISFAMFRTLTVAYQREAVRYVEEGKTVESRQRRADSFARRIAEYLERRKPQGRSA